MTRRRSSRALRRRYGHAQSKGALTRYWLVADERGGTGRIRSWHVTPGVHPPVEKPAFDAAKKHKAQWGEPVTVYAMYEYAEEIGKV